MSKKGFRAEVAQDGRPSYPSFADLDSSRRAFLGRFGALLGAGALAALAQACGSKSLGGLPDRMPAPRDLGTDRQPEMMTREGGPPLQPGDSGGDATPAPLDATTDRDPQASRSDSE
jgi:hypothetical protein